MVILACHSPPRLCPSLDVLHLYVQDCALDTIHAIIVPGDDMIVFTLLTPIPQQRHLSRQIGVVGHRRSTFAVRAQILTWIEAETSDIANGTRAATLIFSPV